MKKNAIIVAGGTGSRMNSSIPKQFLLLQGKPVLYYTIKSFLLSYHDLKIILVLPEDHVAQGQSIIDAFFDYSRIQIAVGGRTRFHSVQNGLKLIQEECIIFVHDAVRCLVSIDLIKRCYDTAIERGSAIPVIDSKDSLRLITEEGNEALERVAVMSSAKNPGDSFSLANSIILIHLAAISFSVGTRVSLLTEVLIIYFLAK